MVDATRLVTRPLAEGPYGIYGGRSYGSLPPPTGPLPQPASTEHSLLRSGSLVSGYKMSGAGYQLKLWEIIIVPWAFQAVILLVFFLAGTHGKLLVLWVAPISMLVLCAAALRHHYLHRHSGEVLIACLCLVSVILGSAVGWYAEVRWLAEYNRLSQGASYFNVLPVEAAASKLDATTIDFTQDTIVDLSQAFGMIDTDGEIGRTYCVAPVMTHLEVQTRIEYFAAGIDCCSVRSDFACGDATHGNAHGGLVLPQALQLDPKFASAVTGFVNAYNFTIGNDFLLLEWNQNPKAFVHGAWSSSWKLLAIFSSAYFLISIMVGVVLLQSFKGRQ